MRQRAPSRLADESDAELSLATFALAQLRLDRNLAPT
jgi:hypothetical protein